MPSCFPPGSSFFFSSSSTRFSTLSLALTLLFTAVLMDANGGRVEAAERQLTFTPLIRAPRPRRSVIDCCGGGALCPQIEGGASAWRRSLSRPVTDCLPGHSTRPSRLGARPAAFV